MIALLLRFDGFTEVAYPNATRTEVDSDTAVPGRVSEVVLGSERPGPGRFTVFSGIAPIAACRLPRTKRVSEYPGYPNTHKPTWSKTGRVNTCRTRTHLPVELEKSSPLSSKPNGGVGALAAYAVHAQDRGFSSVQLRRSWGFYQSRAENRR